MIDQIQKVVLKMGVLSIVLFLASATLVSCNEYVPVLLWSSQITGEPFPVLPALSKVPSNEFSEYLFKRVKSDRPVILLFVEENLSVEDFNWKDVNGNGAFPMLSNLTRMAGEMAFLPSVHDPYKALKNLRSHGYSWKNYEEDLDALKYVKNSILEVKLDEPDYLEDRPGMLKKHDEKMSEIYRDIASYTPNVLVVYTGNHTSWIDAELGRFKREDEDTNDTDSLIITDKDNIVKLVVEPPILFRKKDGNKDVIANITKILGDPTVKDDKEGLIMRVRFSYINNEDLFVEFVFSSVKNNWWTLNRVNINKDSNLVPTFDIGAPSMCSYFCNPHVVFTNGNTTLVLQNLQAQPRLGRGNAFGPVIHCIPFFSISILSGLAVVVILSVVLAWGITMIMDINTNDRFDDPKGKTITIASCD